MEPSKLEMKVDLTAILSGMDPLLVVTKGSLSALASAASSFALPAEVDSIRLLWQSPDEESYSISLISQNPDIMSNPLSTLSSTGTIPAEDTEFYLFFTCIGEGQVPMELNLNISKNGIDYKPVTVVLKKACDPVNTNPDREDSNTQTNKIYPSQGLTLFKPEKTKVIVYSVLFCVCILLSLAFLFSVHHKKDQAARKRAKKLEKLLRKQRRQDEKEAKKKNLDEAKKRINENNLEESDKDAKIKKSKKSSGKHQPKSTDISYYSQTQGVLPLLSEKGDGRSEISGLNNTIISYKTNDMASTNGPNDTRDQENSNNNEEESYSESSVSESSSYSDPDFDQDEINMRPEKVVVENVSSPLKPNSSPNTTQVHLRNNTPRNVKSP